MGVIGNAAWCDYDIAERYGITYKHVQFLAGMAKGMAGVDIAAQLGMTHDGVRTGIKRLFQRMEVHDRAAAVAKAYDIGIFRPLAQRIERAEQMKRLRVAS